MILNGRGLIFFKIIIIIIILNLCSVLEYNSQHLSSTT